MEVWGFGSGFGIRDLGLGIRAWIRVRDESSGEIGAQMVLAENVKNGP